MNELDRLVWAVSRSYEIGGELFAVRCTSRAFGDWVDDVLRTYRTDLIAGTRYSIVIADEPQGATRERFHVLYRGTAAVVKTTSLDELFKMLFHDMETYLFPDRDDALFVDMAPVTMNGQTALLPEVLIPYLATLGHRRVARSGLRLPLAAAVGIDPTDGRIEPVTPRLAADGSSLPAAARSQGDGVPSRAELGSSTRVDVLVSIGGKVPFGPVSKALALYRLASHGQNLPMFEDGGLFTMRDVVQRARCYELAAEKPAQMLQALLDSFEAS